MRATNFDHTSVVQALVYTLFDVFDAARDLYETLAIKELRGYEGNLRTKGYSSSKRVEYVKYENLGHEEKILMDKAAVKRQFDLGYLKFGTEFATGDSFAHTLLQSQIIKLQGVLITAFLYGPTSTESISYQLSKVNAASRAVGMATVDILRDLQYRQEEGVPLTPQSMRPQIPHPALPHPTPLSGASSGIDAVSKALMRYDAPLVRSTSPANTTVLTRRNTAKPDRNDTDTTSIAEAKCHGMNSALGGLYCPYASDLQRHRDLPLASSITSNPVPCCPNCRGTLHISAGKAWELYKEDEGFDRCFQVSNRFVVKCHRGGPDGQYACVLCADSGSVNTVCGDVKALVKHLWSDHTIRDLKHEEDIVEVIEQRMGNRSAGKRDQLLGRIQERHGISRDEAETQVADWESRDGRTPAALWMEKV